jgi:uncharacterized protein YhdP
VLARFTCSRTPEDPLSQNRAAGRHFLFPWRSRPGLPVALPAGDDPHSSEPGLRPPVSDGGVEAGSRLLRALAAVLIGVYFVAGLGYLGLRHLVWPHADRWLPEIEAMLSEALGRPVAAAAIRTGFDGPLPSIEIDRLSIIGADGSEAFSAQRVHAVLSLRHLLIGRLRFARLEVDAPLLRVERLAPGAFEVAGFRIDGSFLQEGQAGMLSDGWLPLARRTILRGADLELIDRVEGTRVRIAGAGLALGTVGRRHRLSLQLPGVPGLAKEVALAFELWRPAFAGFSNRRSWTGELYLAAQDAELPALERLSRALPVWLDGMGLSVPGLDIPAAFEVGSGQAALRLWSKLEAGTLVDGLLKLATARGEIAVLQGALRARSALIEAELFPVVPGDAARRYSVEARLEELSVLAKNGELPVGRLGIPSFESLSGTISLDESGGRIALNSEAAVLHFPGLFAEPSVPFARLEGLARWRRPQAATGEGEGPGLEVDIERLQFENADAEGEVSGRYSRGTAGLGAVDLSGRLTRAEGTRVARYLPLELSPALRSWVADAVRAGFADDVRFEVRGPLHDFPYDKAANGKFRVEADIRDAALAYLPGWPALDRMRGRLVFDRSGIDIAVSKGQLAGLSLQDAHARIDDYDDTRLTLEGRARGPAQEMLRIVAASPVGEHLDDSTHGLTVRGAASLTLGLGMRLGVEADKVRRTLDPVRVTPGDRVRVAPGDPHALKVSGRITLSDNAVVLGEEVPEIRAVSGQLEFSERGLEHSQLAGEFLGGPVRLEGNSTEGGGFVARASGRASAEGLRLLARSPLQGRLEEVLHGAADWRADLESGVAGRTVRIESNLVGLAIRLPVPFRKDEQEAWPLRIESSPPDPSGRELLQLSLRDEVRFVLEREHDSQTGTRRAKRGVLAVSTAPLMPDAGMALRLDTAELDLDAWASVLGPALAATTSAPSAPDAFSLLPTQVSVIAARLRAAGKEFHEVALGATRTGGRWRANVASHEIDGLLDWRAARPGQPIGALAARLTRLEIPPRQVAEFESLLDQLPQVLPALDVVADEFVLNGHRLGRLRLKAVNVRGARSAPVAAPLWRLDELGIEHPAASLKASGTWQRHEVGAPRSTELGFELAVRDAGGVLATLGFPGTVQSGAGSLTGTIGWIGSPLAIDYPSLGGTLRLDIGKGQFLKAEPGMAKLISVLNLQSLRRRLSFDFRDLFAEGFAFDRIHGSASLERGVARTEDFNMRGLAAEVRMRGTANLAAETQDLQVQVRPELNAGLASLAYAALANPVVGLGSFVAQMLLREPLQQLFAWEYEVTGSWSDPHVIKKTPPVPEAPPIGG